MRRLFLIPAIGFLMGAPLWGIAAAHAPDSFLTAELLVVGLMQVICAGAYFYLAVARKHSRR
jgi:hypothetical protein